MFKKDDGRIPYVDIQFQHDNIHLSRSTSTFQMMIYTHYIHGMLVQGFVSGWACCMNQYHYKSRWVVMLSVHMTGEISYKVLYQHIMYVITLSNIPIKTNFKQIIKINNFITVLWERERERETTFYAWRNI